MHCSFIILHEVRAAGSANLTKKIGTYKRSSNFNRYKWEHQLFYRKNSVVNFFFRKLKFVFYNVNVNLTIFLLPFPKIEIS